MVLVSCPFVPRSTCSLIPVMEWVVPRKTAIVHLRPARASTRWMPTVNRSLDDRESRHHPHLQTEHHFHQSNPHHPPMVVPREHPSAIRTTPLPHHSPSLVQCPSLPPAPP